MLNPHSFQSGNPYFRKHLQTFSSDSMCKYYANAGDLPLLSITVNSASFSRPRPLPLKEASSIIYGRSFSSVYQRSSCLPTSPNPCVLSLPHSTHRRVLRLPIYAACVVVIVLPVAVPVLVQFQCYFNIPSEYITSTAVTAACLSTGPRRKLSFRHRIVI